MTVYFPDVCYTSEKDVRKERENQERVGGGELFQGVLQGKEMEEGVGEHGQENDFENDKNGSRVCMIWR